MLKLKKSYVNKNIPQKYSTLLFSFEKNSYKTNIVFESTRHDISQNHLKIEHHYEVVKLCSSLCFVFNYNASSCLVFVPI